MADNTTLNTGTGGNVVRTLEDGSNIHWPVGVVAYATTVGTPDVLSIPIAAALGDDTANPTALLSGACGMYFDGSTWDRMRGTSVDGLLVNLGTNNDVTVTSGSITANAGTNLNTSALALESGGNLATVAAAIRAEDAASASGHTGAVVLGIRKDTPANTSDTDGDYETFQISAGRVWVSATIDAALPAGTNGIGKLTANSGVDIGDVDVTSLTGSTIAHDTADSGNPHKVGAKAVTSLSGATLVANNDRTDLYSGVDGVLVVRGHTNLEDVVQERLTNTDGASTPFVSGLAAPGAGIRLWITTVCIANSSATNITVDLRDGAAGSVLWTIPIPANGGAIQRFDPPLRLTANTALAFDGSAAVTTLTVSASGFKSKV